VATFKVKDSFELDGMEAIFLRGDVLGGTVSVGDSVTASRPDGKELSSVICAIEASDSPEGSHICLGIDIDHSEQAKHEWLSLSNEQVEIWSS
jgi:hypothetical protein